MTLAKTKVQTVKTQYSNLKRLSVEWHLVREVEHGIERRLGRKQLLDHLSTMTLEQLLYMVNNASDAQLSKAIEMECQ